MLTIMAYTTLINAEDLFTNIRPDWVIVDCRFSLANTELGREQYMQLHIPGAFYAHLDLNLSSPITPETGRHPLPDFKKFAATVQSWGVSPSIQVIAYDDIGGAFASRLWWLLQVCGHASVAVLNGGLMAWQEVGGKLTNELPIAPANAPYALTPYRAAWLEVGEIEASLTNKAFELIDARTADRFRGDIEPIDPIAGHIPGALNLPVPNNLIGEKFKSAKIIRENFLKIADEEALENAVHYCGSGVFACHNILSMDYAGLGRGRLYPGSWSEWIRSEKRDKVGTHL